MGATRAEVLEMLESYARMARSAAPVALSSGYLRAIEIWEGLPENTAGAEKGWVERSRREFEAHFARARGGT